MRTDKDPPCVVDSGAAHNQVRKVVGHGGSTGSEKSAKYANNIGVVIFQQRGSRFETDFIRYGQGSTVVLITRVVG